MDLAAKAVAAGGPAWWIAVLVAIIAACASVGATVVAALSARSVKRVEVEAQRTRELEGRISELKLETYKPMIAMLGNLLNATKQDSVLANPQANAEHDFGVCNMDQCLRF